MARAFRAGGPCWQKPRGDEEAQRVLRRSVPVSGTSAPTSPVGVGLGGRSNVGVVRPLRSGSREAEPETRIRGKALVGTAARGAGGGRGRSGTRPRPRPGLASARPAGSQPRLRHRAASCRSGAGRTPGPGSSCSLGAVSTAVRSSTLRGEGERKACGCARAASTLCLSHRVHPAPLWRPPRGKGPVRPASQRGPGLLMPA